MNAYDTANQTSSIIKFHQATYHKYKKIFFGIIFLGIVIPILLYHGTKDNNWTYPDVVNISISGYKKFDFDNLFAEMKYILLWTPSDYAPFYYLGRQSTKFIFNNCEKLNCYVTDDRNYFKGNLSKFDAIAFNGRNIQSYKRSDLPQSRSPHQKYIFFNMESSDNYPICSSIFDNFFNLTSTYKLNSDIPYPYIIITTADSDVVGPKVDMTWPEIPISAIDVPKFNKTKAVAWFVSNCGTKSSREVYVEMLQEALTAYNLNVDIYGSCGSLSCPRSQEEYCNKKLEKEYYFYLAFENTLTEDYVTEKLVTAMQYNVVPIVYGGANYSRFLPPLSYLNAREHKPEDLAELMYDLIASPELYNKYLNQRRPYIYRNPAAVENVCAVCEALNDKMMMKTHYAYKDFRKWWNPNFENSCKISKTSNGFTTII